MVEEMESLQTNETWDLVEIPNGRKPIIRKGVFKKKLNIEGQVKKFKVQLVVKGYSQVEFGDTFSPFAKLTSIRVLMSMVATFDIKI
jgi:hypothetical protein